MTIERDNALHDASCWKEAATVLKSRCARPLCEGCACWLRMNGLARAAHPSVGCGTPAPQIRANPSGVSRPPTSLDRPEPQPRRRDQANPPALQRHQGHADANGPQPWRHSEGPGVGGGWRTHFTYESTSTHTSHTRATHSRHTHITRRTHVAHFTRHVTRHITRHITHMSHTRLLVVAVCMGVFTAHGRACVVPQSDPAQPRSPLHPRKPQHSETELMPIRTASRVAGAVLFSGIIALHHFTTYIPLASLARLKRPFCTAAPPPPVP